MGIEIFISCIIAKKTCEVASLKMHRTHAHCKFQPKWVRTRTSQLATAHRNLQLAIAHHKSCFAVLEICRFVIFLTMNFISAAKITGIVLIIIYTIGGFYVLINGKNIMPWYKVLLGMVFINLINGLLVCGAIKRNGSFLTLWSVLSIIVIISFIIESIRGKEINYSIITYLAHQIH